MKALTPLVDYLESRDVSSENIKLKLVGNRLEQLRDQISAGRLSADIDEKGKKLYDITSAEESMLQRQEQADNAKLANMKLQDDINFSTINISIYQRQAVTKVLLANDKNISAFQPAFGSRISEAFKVGWSVFQDIIIILISGWQGSRWWRCFF